MTREEGVKEIFKSILDAKSQFDAYGIESTEYNLKVNEKFFNCLDMAIKALEQESVLDKIRAEIEHIGGDDEKAFCKNLNESYKQGLKDALKVIDKYRKGR